MRNYFNPLPNRHLAELTKAEAQELKAKRAVEIENMARMAVALKVPTYLFSGLLK